MGEKPSETSEGMARPRRPRFGQAIDLKIRGRKVDWHGYFPEAFDRILVKG